MTHFAQCRILSLLLGGMKNHTYKFDTFISILIVLTKNHRLAESSTYVISWMHQRTTRECFVLFNFRNFVFYHRWHRLMASLLDFDTRISALIFHHSSINFFKSHPCPNPRRSNTDANVSGIAEVCANTDQPLPATLAHVATSRHTDLLSPSFCIVGSDISVRFKVAAVMESQLMI